jgi:hypothetical protein
MFGKGSKRTFSLLFTVGHDSNHLERLLKWHFRILGIEPCFELEPKQFNRTVRSQTKRYKKLYRYKSLIDNKMFAATILRIGIEKTHKKHPLNFFI